ncbi:MAG: hypothetical protein CVV47_12185 [Spirochaetae bacterium HGW-Spirochaetae-3]|jgi:hypothetical protein|nr:MAG: hypothetical protein CVV47_12185 [Spirochaetae bacterium HGW-Spirochaetae-3]
MSQTNLINLKISDDDVAIIHDAIETLRATLMPHLKTLNIKERNKMLKLGDKSVAFVQKSFEYGEQYKNLVPSFLAMEAFGTDIKATDTLQLMIRALAPICEALEDSLMLTGSEAYEGALMFYQNVKGAARAKDPNAKMIFDDLSDQFKKAPRRKD